MTYILILHEKGSGNPLGINSNSDRIPFHPYYTLRDIMGFMMFSVIFIIFLFIYPKFDFGWSFAPGLTGEANSCFPAGILGSCF